MTQQKTRIRIQLAFLYILLFTTLWAVPPPKNKDNNINRLHISLSENDLLKYRDTAYVRVYQTVFSATEGTSINTFPDKIHFKDMWQDAAGRVIIVPGDSLENPTWVGFGDPRNQLKFIENYKTQLNPADNPLIRSFLVDYETVQKILIPRRIATEDPKYTGLGLSLNVDKHAANQFGLNRLDADELRKHALPESLVTYTTKPIEKVGHEHWGTIRPIEDLYDKLGLPSEDIPGAYSNTANKERVKGSNIQIDNYLEDLEKLYQKSLSGVNVDYEIQGKLGEFNDKYIFEKLRASDLPVKDSDLSWEKQKILGKLKKQIHDFSEELQKLYDNPNVLYADVENKVNEFNDKYRRSAPAERKLSIGKLPDVTKDANAMQKQLLSDIGELNELHERSLASGTVIPEIDTKLQQYNNYMTAEQTLLEKRDLSKVKAFMEEAKVRRQINERFNSVRLDPHLRNKNELHWDKIPAVETDHMFTAGNDINMYELIQKGDKFQSQAERAKTFLATLEAYSKELNGIVKRDKSPDLNMLRKPFDTKSLLKEAFQNDPNILRKIEYGFFLNSGDFGDEYIQNVLNDINNKVAEKIPNSQKKVSIRRQLSSFSDNIARGPHAVTYRSEVIVQLGTSSEVNKASAYLYNRYTKEGKIVKHIIYDNSFYHTVDKTQVVTDLDSSTRISVIGHGRQSQSHLQVEGKDPVTLGKDLSRVLFPKSGDERATVGKISLIACNYPANEAVEIGTQFGQDLVEELNRNNIQSDVTVRVGELVVSEDGYKLYGKSSEQRQRDRLPVFVRKTKKAGTVVSEYGIIDSNTRTVKWNKKVPNNVENTKLLILSESYGSNDIAGVVDKTHLKSMKFVDNNMGTSGTLSFQDQDVIVDGNEGFQRSKPGIYLDVETPKEIGLPLFDDTGTQSILTEIDAADWVDKLSVATSEAISDLPDTGDWVPLIDTAELDENGKTRLTVVNLDTSETKSVAIKSDAYVQFKKRSRLHGMSVRNLPKITKSTIGMAGTGSILGLGGFIMSAIQLSKSSQCRANVTCPTTESARKLAKSLEINAYVGFAMGTYGLISDSVQIAELAVAFKLNKNAINGIATMTKTTSKFLKFSKVFGSVGMGVGAVGSVASLGFSAYQLAHAETQAQKIEFGIQVAIDSVNVIVSGVAIGATIAAAVTSSAVASSIAAAAGPVGLVVAVVGIFTSAITGLVFEFKNTRNNARQVGEYFYTLDDVYRQYGYDFDDAKNTFKILENAIVSSVDFVRGEIQLDSQYIYRTRHGSTGSGRINYFFWFNDFPEMINDKHQAINIRNGIGYTWRYSFYSEMNTETLILPVIPKSYISYSYSRLPFCTAMHDKGFDIIRRLEQDERFDYDFYIFPGEQIISSISHEYVSTTLTVTLSNNVKTVAVPDISEDKYSYLHNKYTFKLKTKSQKHTILLQDYFTFYLQRESSTSCSWYLSYASIDFDNVVFKSAGLIQVGKVNIYVSQSSDKLYLYDDEGGTLLIDPHTKTKTLISVIQDSDMSSNELKNYLKGMDRSWLQSQKYVVVSKFTHNGKYMGRAFYDTHLGTFLFTDLHGVRVSKQFKDNIQLLGVFKDDVYFMSNESTETVIWRTHISTHEVIASYVLYCGNSEFQISKLAIQGNFIYLIQKVYDVSLVYMIQGDDIKLSFIDGLTDNIYKLADSCFPNLNEFMQRQTANLPFPGKCAHAKTIPILPMKQTLKDKSSRHFWLYMNDSQVNLGNDKDIFCLPNKPPAITGVITPHIDDPCDNLSLRDIQSWHSGEEVFFFYCEGDKNRFYYQIADNESVEVFVPGEIERIEDFGTIKLIKSTNGGYYKFTNTKNFTLAALSFEIITAQSDWRKAIGDIANQALVETFIPILNMKNIRQKVITAWYDPLEDRLIIVSPSVNADNIVYLGPTRSKYLVWLYNPNQRQLILQKVLEEDTISNMIVRRGNDDLWRDDVSPHAKIMASDTNSVEFTQGSVFVVSKEGVMFDIDYLDTITLLGVNATWIVNNNVSVNNMSLNVELDKLCNQYRSLGLITMGKQHIDSNTTVFKWFHCALKCQVALAAETNRQPIYLGSNEAERFIFFLLGQDIIRIDANETKEIYTEGLKTALVRNAMVRRKTLFLQPLILQSIPKLDGVESLVVGTAYITAVTIESHDWLYYKEILVTSIGTSGPQFMSLTLQPPYHCSFQFGEVGNDTVIRDPLSERVIIFEDFAIHFDKYTDDYMPVGNEAVLRVRICDNNKTVTLVTNRERFAPSVSMPLKYGPVGRSVGMTLLGVFLAAVFFAVICSVPVCIVCKKRRNKRRKFDQCAKRVPVGDTSGRRTDHRENMETST